LLDIPRRNPKNGEDLSHYLSYFIHHFRSLRHLCVDFETLEKSPNALKDVHKSFFAFPNILRRLRNIGVTLAQAKPMRIHTEMRTSIPAKITVAGENVCQINMSVHVSDNHMSYQVNSSSYIRERKKGFYNWIEVEIEPLGQSFIGSPELIEPVGLLL
jgi:hypothetical protein